MKYILILLLLFPLPAISDTSDKLENAATVLILSDWYTTREALKIPGVYETNRTLGNHPSNGKINRFFIGKLAFHYWINHGQDSKLLRNSWNVFEIFITFDAVKGNMVNLGYKF